MFSLFFFVTSLFSVQSSVYGADTHFRGTSFLEQQDEWGHFIQFQERFNKNYETMIELESRFEIFRENVRNIVLHNLDTTQNFTMGINQFTDLTIDEFSFLYANGLRNNLGSSSGLGVGSYGCKTYSGNAAGAPASLDWRSKGAVTSVKDQGQCGSCWTFSATGAVEGAWAVSTGQLVDLSEEQLVECATGISYGSHGCNGGQMEGAFKYVVEHGQCTNAAYPYSSGNGQSGSCKSCSSVAHISYCSDVKPNDQVSLKAATFIGPVAVALSADTVYFQSYSSGVLTSKSCYTQLNHGVLVVGYGEENGNKYWLVKNSWGDSWGDKGYIKILRSESTNDPGICGIAMQPSFPTV